MSFSLIVQKFKFRDLLAQYGAAVTVGAISFVISATIARRIGPEAFGIYATALSVGAALGIFLDFGFRHLVQREAARSSMRYSYRQLQGAAIANILIIAAMFVLGCAIFFRNHLILAGCVAVCFAGATLTQLISAGLRGRKHFVQDALHQVASRAISAAFIIVSLILLPDVAIILGAWGIGLFAWAIFAFWKFSNPLPGRLSNEIYSNALPLFLIDLLIVLHFRVDLIFMQYFGVDQAFIGNFSAALRVVELFIFLTFPLRSILLTQIRQETREEAIRYLNIRCAIAGAVGLFLALAIQLVASLIVEVVFGSQFVWAADMLRVMIWLLIPSFVLAIVFETAVATNNERAYQAAAIVSVLATFASLTAVIHCGTDTLFVYLKVALELVFALSALGLIHRSLAKIDGGIVK
jgi:PST family polysaccharide transporter